MSFPLGGRCSADGSGTTIKVSNLLDGSCTEARLTETFARFGPIVDLRVGTQHATITYETSDSAKKVIASTSGIVIGGRVVNVALCPPTQCDDLGVTLDGSYRDSIFKGFSQGLNLGGSKESRRKFSLEHIRESDSESATSKGLFSFSLANQVNCEHSSIQLPGPIAGTKHRRLADINDLPDYESDSDLPPKSKIKESNTTKQQPMNEPLTSPMPPHKPLFNERRDLVTPSLETRGTRVSGLMLGEANSLFKKEQAKTTVTDDESSCPLSSFSTFEGVKLSYDSPTAANSCAPKIDLSHLCHPNKSPSLHSPDKTSPTVRTLGQNPSPSFVSSSGSPIRSPTRTDRPRSSPDLVDHSRPVAAVPGRRPPSRAPINAAKPPPVNTRPTLPSGGPPTKLTPASKPSKSVDSPSSTFRPHTPPSLPQTASNSSTSLSVASDNRFQPHPIKSSVSAVSAEYPIGSKKSSIKSRVSPPPSLSTRESFLKKSSSKRETKSQSPKKVSPPRGLSLSHLREPVKSQPSSRSIPVPNPIVVKALTHDSQTKRDVRKIKCDTKVSEVKILPPPSHNLSGVPTISISGEPERVEKAFSLVQEKLSTIERQIQTKNYCMDVFYSPLLAMKDSEIFERIKTIEDENCVSFLVQRVDNKKYPVTMFSSLVQTSDSLLRVSELRKAELLMSPMSWSVQSFSGNWFPWPVAVNEYLNKCLQESIKSFDYTDTENGIVYRIDLNKMEAVDTQQGTVHSLKAEPSQACTWRGVVPYTDAQAVEIEMCLRHGIVKSVNCNGRQCYFDFHSSMEINVSDGQATIVKREPNIPSEYLNPRVKVVARGMLVDGAVRQLDCLLQSRLEEEVVPLPGGGAGRSTHPSLVVQFVQQYCVRGTCSTLGDTIRIQGIDKNYIAKVIVELMKSIGSIQFAPSGSRIMSNFQTPVGWYPQVDDTEVFDVVCGSQDWESVKEIWQRTCSWSIVRIQRIQSRWLWRQYTLSRERLAHKNNGRHNEILLFHGTSTTNPPDVYNSERGFDARFSRPGMWGTGIYFAVNAAYSAKSYAYEQLDKSRQVFLARVLTGDSIVCSPSQALKMPPLKDSADGSSERYDSIKGNVPGRTSTEVYIVYDQDKAYPEYLITFTT